MSAAVILVYSSSQRFVIARAGKYERRHQRAGAHAGDDRIIRPVAGGAQAVEQAGAERAVGAAGGENEPGARLRRQRLLEVGRGSAQNRASGMPGMAAAASSAAVNGVRGGNFGCCGGRGGLRALWRRLFWRGRAGGLMPRALRLRRRPQ